MFPFCSQGGGGRQESVKLTAETDVMVNAGTADGTVGEKSPGGQDKVVKQVKPCLKADKHQYVRISMLSSNHGCLCLTQNFVTACTRGYKYLVHCPSMPCNCLTTIPFLSVLQY